MLFFDSKNERESYPISNIEWQLAHEGKLHAYQRDTRMLWRPIGTGENPSNWETVSGPFKPRAFWGQTLREDTEHVLSATEITANTHHIVFGELIVDAPLTVNGQIEFRQDDTGEHVAMQDTLVQRGEMTLEGQMTLDGELQFEPTHEDVNLSMQRKTITHDRTVTIPDDYQLHVVGGLQVDGNLITNGEFVE
jgi:hypothetical protein